MSVYNIPPITNWKVYLNYTLIKCEKHFKLVKQHVSSCHKLAKNYFPFQWLAYIKDKNLLLPAIFEQFFWLKGECISFLDISDGQKLKKKKKPQAPKVAFRENALRKVLNGNPESFWLSCCANLKPRSLQQYLFQPKMSLPVWENLKVELSIYFEVWIFSKLKDVWI